MGGLFCGVWGEAWLGTCRIWKLSMQTSLVLGMVGSELCPQVGLYLKSNPCGPQLPTPSKLPQHKVEPLVAATRPGPPSQVLSQPAPSPPSAPQNSPQHPLSTTACQYPLSPCMPLGSSQLNSDTCQPD